jgi:uncharacterized protein DUF3800
MRRSGVRILCPAPFLPEKKRHMSNIINVYCDESCHLEHDQSKAMVLGAIWCPYDLHKSLARAVQELKRQHGFPPEFEIKWTKVSSGQVNFYLDVVDLFFNSALLHFRGVVVPNKEVLDHERFRQTHDEFYYKMWFLLLGRLLSDRERFRIYVDIKDSRSAEKVHKLHEVLCNARYDFDFEIIEWIQTVHSHDVPLLQLADFLVGALSYFHRGLSGNKAKIQVLDRIRRHSGHTLGRSTLLRESKFNLLVWSPQEVS